MRLHCRKTDVRTKAEKAAWKEIAEADFVHRSGHAREKGVIDLLRELVRPVAGEQALSISLGGGVVVAWPHFVY